MSPLFYSLLSVLIISLISIAVIYWLISRIPSFSRYSIHIVGLAVGGLLGDAFIHILPEAYSRLGFGVPVALLTIAGVLLFFSLEKFIRWHHCHDPECQDDDTGDHIVPISLVGESFHNFIDGVIIASGFTISLPLGLATALAVLIHEIPQEIGDFGIYTHQGLTLKKSLYLNLFCALFSLFGVIFTFLIGTTIVDFAAYVLPVTAGGFIYLAASDLIPELHRHHPDVRQSFLQILLVVLGVALMLSLIFLE